MQTVHNKLFVLFHVSGAITKLKPCWSRLGSEWVFLLILGIIMSLISFFVDLTIDKCQTGWCHLCRTYVYKYVHTSTK